MKRTDKPEVTINIHILSHIKFICDTKTIMIVMFVLMVILFPFTLAISSGNYDMLADMFRSFISIAFGS